MTEEPTQNPSLHEIATARISRRALLGGGIAAAAAFGFLGGPAKRLLDDSPPGTAADQRGSLLGFEAVASSSVDALVVAKGYTAQVLIPWGTPLLSSGPAWRKDASNPAAGRPSRSG